MSWSVIVEAGVPEATVRLEGNDGASEWVRGLNDPQAPAQLSAHVAGHGLELTSLELRPTAAAVEHRLPNVCAICIGLARRAFDRLDLPARIAVSGLIDINGVEQVAPDDQELVAALAPVLETHRLEGFAVSAVNSGRNPAHEQRTAVRLRELTGLPVLEARFWGESLDAGRRALAAARGLATLLILLDLHRHAAAIQHALEHSLPSRAIVRDPALLSAMLNAPEFGALAALADGEAHLGLVQARVTRSESGYVCHCTDGAFEFESITLAKQFADRHLREQLAFVGVRLGAPGLKVELQSHDRYTFVRGKRGPVRVYLETIVTARART